ncbi:hypothetical protein HDU99_000650 [Rhizoclosmatium hyalinum]|nr:hypothetical protein HDU99_000650 [Rhizoclosmatium hyalinum]
MQDFLNRIEGISIPHEYSSFREDLITAVKKDERMLQIVLLICTRTGLIKSWDNSMVYFAAKLGCSQMLRIFMDHHIAPDDKCLQIASQNGHAECLQLILRDQSVNPNAHDSSSLLMALQNGRHEVIKVLLEDPRTDVSCCKGEVFTLACKHGYFDIISRQVGALNVLPTVFHLTEALRFKHEDVAVYLLSNKIAPIQPLPEHLLLASEHDPLSCKTNPFLRAVTAGFRSVVELYLPTYPHLVKSKWLCLALDAKAQQEEILMLLLQVPGLDASVNNNRCIRVCLEKGYWKAVDVLLSRNEVIGQVNNPELFLAACKVGRVDVIEKLGALGIGKWLTFDVIDEASDEGHETIMDCLMKFAAELL